MGQTQQKQWTEKGEYNKAAITKMKPALLAIEGQFRESNPAPAAYIDEREISDKEIREKNAREAVLSAMGSLASVDERRLDNPAYARNIQESIDQVTKLPSGMMPSRIQKEAVGLVTGNAVVMKGLGQLEAAISSKLASAHRNLS